MKKCKKCGNEIPEDSRHKVCDECEHKKWERLKKIGPFVGLAVVVTGIIILASKNRTDEDSSLEGDDDSSDLYEHTDLIDDSSSFTGKISQSIFMDIVHEVSREMPKVKSVDIHGSAVNVTFKSNSGKQTWGTIFDFDDDGEITGNSKYYLPAGAGPYATANAPRFFGEKVGDKIREMLDDES